LFTVRGRAYELLTAFTSDVDLATRPFMTARLVLLARVIPDHVTPELDDPDLEARLEQAIAQIRASLQGSPTNMTDNPHRIRTLEPADLASKLSHYRVVDIRTQAEWDNGHIEGAEHVPLDTLTAALVAGWDRSQPLCLVCRVGHRSSIAVLRLQGFGFQQVWNLDGGMLAWGFAGLTTTPALIGKAH